MKKRPVSAITDFVFIPTTDWKEIDRHIRKERYLRVGVVRVERNGVVLLCTRGS